MRDRQTGYGVLNSGYTLLRMIYPSNQDQLESGAAGRGRGVEPRDWYFLK